MTPEGAYVILALDTSTDALCCAVAEWLPHEDGAGADVRMLASGDRMCRRQANVQLVSVALEALAEAGLAMGDVDAVLVGRGPGSFTGVRIGIATAKGLACGLGVMLHGTSTLDAMAWRAWAAGTRGLLGVVGDAMRGEVYPGIYELDETGARRTFATESVCKADAAVELWRERADADQLQLTGDGLRKYRDRFEAAGLARVLPEELWFPSGEGLLLAAASPERYDAQEDGDPALVLPVYTRLSDAEENERVRLGMEQPASVEVTGTADALADRHLQLRPMSVNDIAQVAALEARAYEDAAHDAWGEKLFYEELSQPGRTWWVAHDMGSIVGYAGGMMAGDDLEVLDVVCAPERRREHVATRLLARVAYDAQVLNANTISLEVEDGNEAALALYGGLGFEQVGRRRNYYGPGADALVMRATLPLVAAAGTDEEPGPAPSLRSWPPACEERTPECQAAIEAAGDLILAIESSCDETAMAVVDGAGNVVASVVATQIDFHARFGGVVPEIASRKHVEAIVGVYEECMEQAGEHFGCASLAPADLAAVAVTYGPGLVGALVVGVAFAKGMCAACDLPLIGVNHLEGHLFANLFVTPDLEPPFVASLVSGGNTMLVHVRDWGSYRVMGETIDDAVGEAFDKVAKALGLGYPGGPVISKLAERGNPKAIRFPRAMMHSGDYRFSLSGLKTSVMTYIQGENRAGRPINLPDLAASFQAAVVDVQVAKAVAACEETDVSDFCCGGGVASNPSLRATYERKLGKRGVRVTVPPPEACTDNAAMIALVARRLWGLGQTSPLTLDAAPGLRLDV